MNAKEYNNIIDKWTTEYNMEINPIYRPALVESYNEIVTLDGFKNLSFNLFIRELIRKNHYDKKYPFLNLLESAYSIPSQN